MLVNRDLLGSSVRATVRRWLPFVTNSPVPRRPLLVVTAVTAAAVVAAGGSTAAPESAQPDQIVTVPAAGAESGSTAAAAPAEPGRAATAGSASRGSADERAAKVAAAREKASRAKADRAQALAPGRSEPKAKGPSSAGASDKANKADKPGKANGARKNQVPSNRELMPNGTPGGQSAFAPSQEQVRNAKQIVRTGERLNMPPRAHVIAVATALQESKLENLGHLGARNDHDSLGLFQQRPSSGWGTPQQVTDPDYAAEQFYRGLARVPGYKDLPLTAAAQTVQVSAFPDAYAQWEKMAADLVLAAHGAGPYAGIDDARN